MFSWQLGQQKVTAVLEYDVMKSLLTNGDSKVRAALSHSCAYALWPQPQQVNESNGAKADTILLLQ